MAMKIRQAMIDTGQRNFLTGLVEMDETYIGGKPRKGNGQINKRGRGTRKAPVVGIIEREGMVTASPAKNGHLTTKNLTDLVRRNVDTNNATLITDEFTGYIGISRILPHEIVDHSKWYVDGFKHTNNIESFWALLKRGIVGQYHKVSLYYLPRYIDEFCYRHNHRKDTDLFSLTILRGLGV
jgi:hypothetical protein